MTNKFKQDKGVAGLTILLSLVVMLFIIGLIVMIFTLMGSQLSNAVYTPTNGTATENNVKINSSGYTLLQSTKRGFVGTIINVTNATDSVVFGATNYTLTGGVVTNASSTLLTNVNISYSYSFNDDNTATKTINDTTSAIAGVSDWFGIFIVIGAMVVLILLTVIIITAIRSSGMIGGADHTGNTVGTA